MYLFAQRVRSARGKRGINAGLYVHAGEAHPADLWSREISETRRLVTNRHPGRRTRDKVEVAPGGNAVESWLDIMGPDTITTEEMLATVGAIRSALDAAAVPPVTKRVGQVTAVFGCNFGVDAPGTELETLAREALGLVDGPVAPRVVQAPLVVLIETDETESRYRLEASSARRVQDAGGTPASMSIRHDVESDFEAMHGDLHRHLPELVTGLSRDELLELGGIVFRENGTTVFEWPVRP